MFFFPSQNRNVSLQFYIMIKALVLDYGNVITEPHDSTCFDRMSALTELSADFFRTSFSKYRSEFDRGSIDGVSMYKKILADGKRYYIGTEATDLAEQLLEEDFASWFHISVPVTEWALQIQKEGFKLGVLSNMPHEFLEQYESKIILFQKADVTVFSCNEGIIKPEPAIYELTAKKLACKPQEIVFFDDLQENIDAARSTGFNAFLWTGLEQAKKDWNIAISS